MSAMRVAHVIGSTGLYGAERGVLALLRHFEPGQVQTTLVNLVDEPAAPSALVRAARDRGLDALDFTTGGRFNPAGVVRLARFVKAGGYRILHAHGYKADALALLAARLTGTRVVSTPHGFSRAAGRVLAAYEAFDRWLLRFVDGVYPLSEELRDQLRRSGVPERRLILVPNALDIDEVDQAVPTLARRDGETVIGYLGRLIRSKNVECLIEAFSRVAAGRADVRLAIAGEGPLAAELQALARQRGVAERVEFTGYRTDGVGVLKAFDLFVFPSLQEATPRCVMEAMAAGVPVLASDIPGNRVLIEDGDSGMLVPPSDPERLAGAILGMLEDTERTKAMVTRARARVERHFSARRMAEDHVQLYARCLDGDRA
jgi:glycosyltransferase involved in cell wall biosynthesis